MEDFVLLLKMNDQGGMDALGINLDTSDFRTRYGREEVSSIKLMLLELESRFKASQWQTKGLVLRCGTISQARRAPLASEASGRRWWARNLCTAS